MTFACLIKIEILLALSRAQRDRNALKSEIFLTVEKYLSTINTLPGALTGLPLKLIELDDANKSNGS